MTQFEYLAVLVSVILGLGMTHLLLGFGRMIHRRRSQPFDTVHLLWSVAVFVVLILNWWTFFQSQAFDSWTFDLFLFVILWAVCFFLLVVVLFPPGLRADENAGQLFAGNRHWFLGFWALSSMIDIALTALRGQLFDPPFYLPFVLHFVLLAAIGIWVKSRRYHVFLASYVLVIGIAWAMLVRRTLQ